MELVVLTDASMATREMLLDTFMDGLLYKLFQHKWHRYARAQHYLLHSVDAGCKRAGPRTQSEVLSGKWQVGSRRYEVQSREQALGSRH